MCPTVGMASVVCDDEQAGPAVNMCLVKGGLVD
jgi:hypothetical protein